MPQGAGPDEARRDKSWFKVDFIAESDGRKVHTRVSGGDPGYTETAKMLAESALCLAYDENPKVAGQVTTAEAMGENLTARLISAGLTFEHGQLKSDSPIQDPSATPGGTANSPDPVCWRYSIRPSFEDSWFCIGMYCVTGSRTNAMKNSPASSRPSASLPSVKL